MDAVENRSDLYVYDAAARKAELMLRNHLQLSCIPLQEIEESIVERWESRIIICNCVDIMIKHNLHGLCIEGDYKKLLRRSASISDSEIATRLLNAMGLFSIQTLSVVMDHLANPYPQGGSLSEKFVDSASKRYFEKTISNEMRDKANPDTEWISVLVQLKDASDPINIVSILI